MPTLNILWPTFALVLLIFMVWFVMVVQRFGHLRRHPPRREDLASGDAATRYFAPVEMAANNLRSLFEMPVLFLALVPLLLVTRHADHLQVLLAWVFVALRALHSLIHIGPKQVTARFLVYLASCIVLAVMWIGFFVDMVAVANAWHAAMATMPAAEPIR